MSWWSKFRNTLTPGRLDDELDEEMRDHLQRRADEMRRAGIAPDEARRLARRAFGNLTAIRERSREIRLWSSLEGTIQDLQYAARGLRKSPSALTAVCSLGLAIGSITAIYTIIDAAMLRPLPVPNPERLITLAAPETTQAGHAAERELFSVPAFLQLQAAAQGSAELRALSSRGSRRVSVRGFGGGHRARHIAVTVSGDAFEMLRVQPVQGRLISRDDDRTPGVMTIVLSDGTWRRRFNRDPRIIGRRMFLEGRPGHVVGGLSQACGT